MSNKVIFNLDELFISVGIDVGADFSWMSIALPNQQFVGKPYKILHNSIDSLTTAVSKIKEAEELYSLESRIFLESTGIYHYPLFCYLRDKGFNCSVINPIITKNSTNINIRKVHNDRFDSKKAALVGLKPDLKVSLMPSDLALNCRNLCREYYDLIDNRSAYVNKLQGELRMAFPQYLGIFSKVQMSKRGSAIARRVIHTLTLQSISISRNREAKNPVLREYYLKKCDSKPKLVAMGAVSHKVCNMIFAILRDNKPFKIIAPQEHIKQYNSAKCDIAA